MKRLLAILVLLCLSISIRAQTTPSVITMHDAATATGNGTAIVVGVNAANPGANLGAVGVQIVGSGTWEVTFEATTDGTNWSPVMATNLEDDVRATTATAAGQYTILYGSAIRIRARISSFSSGSVTVKGRLIPGLTARLTSGGGGGGGSGDVVGPASATDNAVARFNLTTGKLIQNSVVTIGDTGNTTGIANLTFTGVLTGGSAPTTITDSAGKILSAALNTVQPAQGGTGITALGTGIATALGVNIGSAGAPVLFDGAGGTPSSLTLTNATGLPLSTGVTGNLPFANFVQAGSAGFVGATGAGDYSHRTPAQVTAALDAFVGDSGSGGTKGLVPAPASGDAAANKYLKADGTWATVAGGGTPGGSNTQVQYNNAGSFGGVAGFTFNGTSTISLGVAGTSVGAIGFRNATSGTITLQPVTGALGTVTLSLPAATDTLVGRATTDTLSNKTLASPSLTGNLSGATTSEVRFGANIVAYEDGVGPKFTDSNTGAMLTFDVQNLTGSRVVTWPNVAGNAALTDGTLTSGNCAEFDASGRIVDSGGVCGGSGGITVGATAVTSGTAGRLFYETAGNVVGQISGATSDGTNVTFGSGNLLATSPVFTTNQTTTNDAIGTTSTDGIVLQNTTAAAAGAQQYSPRLRLTGQGWKTNATAASQTVDWVTEVQPAQGTANPTANLVFKFQVNAGGFTDVVAFRQANESTTSGGGKLHVLGGNGQNQILTGYGKSYFGSNVVSGGTAASPSVMVDGGNATIGVRSGGQYSFSSSSSDAAATQDLFLMRAAAANLRLGAADAASPVAQTLSVQNVVGGTSNTAGANWTLAGSRGTGTGAGGSIIIQTAPPGSSGSTQNALVTAIEIPAAGGILFPELGSAPGTPAANRVHLYARDDGGVSNLYFKKDDGTEINLSNTGSGLGDPGANGIVVRTALNTTTARAVAAGSSGGLSVANGDGVSGNPTVDFATTSTSGIGFALPGGGGIPIVGDTSAALVGSANEVRVVLFYAPMRVTVDRIGANGVTNGSGNNAGFGIYTADGNTKVCDSGAISTTSWSGAAAYSLSGSCTFGPGYYYYAWTADNTTPTVRSGSAFTNYFAPLNTGTGTVLGTAANSSSGGVLPSTLGTLTDSSSLAIPIVRFYKN